MGSWQVALNNSKQTSVISEPFSKESVFPMEILKKNKEVFIYALL